MEKIKLMVMALFIGAVMGVGGAVCIPELAVHGLIAILFLIYVADIICSYVDKKVGTPMTVFHFVAAGVTFAYVAYVGVSNTYGPIELWQPMEYDVELHADCIVTSTSAAVWWYVLAALPVLRLIVQMLICRRK